MSKRCLTLVLVGFAAAVGCSEERAGPPTPEPLVTWIDDVEAVVGARCATAGCHAGPTPAAGYDLTTYAGALGVGTDATADAIAGDPSSVILTQLDDGNLHAAFADVIALLRSWVVDSRLAYRRSRFHDPGLLDPASEQFHGKELQRRSWNFPLCQTCHGEDFSGNKNSTSCLSCHRDGPTSCDTCHGKGPTTNAHPAHLVTGIACSECHRVPTQWDDPGHIIDASGKADPLPAEVTLGARANLDVTPPRRTAPAAYDPATGRCDNVYCHGAVLGDPAAANIAPSWNAGPPAAACGTCHGKPPTSHSQNDCITCHSSTVTANDQFTNLHVDGIVQIGDGSGTCTACHGSGTNAAPPRGLHGEQFTTSIAVGAHRAHLDAPSRLRGPIACNECHVVPAAVGDAGHIDSASPAEVFPSGSGLLARADGAVPAWDRMTATCSGSYCHGDGTRLAADSSPGRVRTPNWIASSGQVYCGSCHGTPPTTAPHTSNMTIASCTTCHPSVDSFGNIVFTGPQTTKHLDGVVDVR
jgi:predicted CxxxxCH...CXXCH cytochrome family protein